MPSGLSDLTTVLEGALKGSKLSGDRLHTMTDGSQRVVTEWDRSGKYLSGVLVEVMPGSKSLGIRIDPTKERLSLEQFKPAVQGMDQASVLFFVARDNHFAFLATQGLVGDQVENYINWFLRDKLQLFHKGPEQVRLRPRSSRRSEAQLKQVRSISVKTTLEGAGGKPDVGHASEAGIIVSALGELWDQVGPLGQKLNILNDKTLGSLEVTIKISLAGRRRRDRSEILQWLAGNMGDNVTQLAEIQLPNGKIIRGDQIVVKGEGRVVEEGGPVYDSARVVLRQFLQQLIENGEI